VFEKRVKAMGMDEAAPERCMKVQP